jgi:hypothetical protein
VRASTCRCSLTRLPLVGRALFVLCLCSWSGACKTVRQKDDTVVVVNTNPTPGLSDELPAGAPSQPGAMSSILTETLSPVRGGERVLPPYRGAEPCQMALRGESPVAKVCSERGLRGALDLMQTFVKRAKAEGITFVCTDCHADEDDYMHLKPSADAEFRKLLFLARPAD